MLKKGSTYELERSVPKVKSKKGYWINEGRVSWKNNERFVGLGAKFCNYLIDDGSEDKKEKSTKYVS